MIKKSALTVKALNLHTLAVYTTFHSLDCRMKWANVPALIIYECSV